MSRQQTGGNGRDGAGRFAKGNAGGPGNPHGGTVSRLRATLLDAVTEDDLRAVVAALVRRAREGDVPAIRELLDRACGKPRPAEADGAGEQPLAVKVIILDGPAGDAPADLVARPWPQIGAGP
jgi:hypothetical protein